MNNCSQSHNNQFIYCEINGDTSSGDYDIKQTGNGGYFSVPACEGGYHTLADFRIGDPNLHIVIDEWNSENSMRLLDCEDNFGANWWPVYIRGGRWESSVLASDGEFIQYFFLGPLVVENQYVGSLASTSPPAPRIGLRLTATPPTIRHFSDSYAWNNAGATYEGALSIVSGDWTIEDGGNLFQRAGQNEVRLVKHQNTI
jgi:hypothetical protein